MTTAAPGLVCMRYAVAKFFLRHGFTQTTEADGRRVFDRDDVSATVTLEPACDCCPSIADTAMAPVAPPAHEAAS